MSSTRWKTAWHVCIRASVGRSFVIFAVLFIFPVTLQGDHVLPTSLREKWKHREESDLPRITQLGHSRDGVKPGCLQDTILSLRTRCSGHGQQEGVKCPRKEKSEQNGEAPGGEGRVRMAGSRGPYAWPCSPPWHGLPREDAGGAPESTCGAPGPWLGHTVTSWTESVTGPGYKVLQSPGGQARRTCLWLSLWKIIVQ